MEEIRNWITGGGFGSILIKKRISMRAFLVEKPGTEWKWVRRRHVVMKFGGAGSWIYFNIPRDMLNSNACGTMIYIYIYNH